jgi:hypothetical protein
MKSAPGAAINAASIARRGSNSCFQAARSQLLRLARRLRPILAGQRGQGCGPQLAKKA